MVFLARARNIGQAYGPLGVVLPAAEAEVDVVSAREMDSGPPSPFYGLILPGVEPTGQILKLCPSVQVCPNTS